MQAAPAVSKTKTTPVEKTPSASKQITLMDVVSKLLFIVFSAVGIYFGWKFGRQYGAYFWGVIQAIGSVIRSYLVELIRYVQEYARRSR